MPQLTIRIWAAALLLAALAAGPLAAAQDEHARDEVEMSIAVPGQERARAPELSPEARAQIARAIAAVGLISVRNTSREGVTRNPTPRGSGVVVTADGVVATNFHVIARDKSQELFDEIYFSLAADESQPVASAPPYRLKPVVLSPADDLALLRIASDGAGRPLPASTVYPSVEIGDSVKARLLDGVVIIGFPEVGGSSVTVNMGRIEGNDALGRWLKTDARLIHGNSGGAAVGVDGKLVGIPTKVVVDSRPVDRDGDGFPDTTRPFGAVGYLRPSSLVGAMLATLHGTESAGAASPGRLPGAVPSIIAPATAVTIRGTVRSVANGRPVAGARVGLVPVGTQQVTAETLLTWGGTNGDGQFELNKPVPPGRYSLRAKALGYEAYAGEIEVGREKAQIALELRPSGRQ
jgi:S1-C subfamily serine protease